MENYKPTRTLTEMFAEVRENFEKENGRLLTEDEALAYTEEIRRDIQSRKDNIEGGKYLNERTRDFSLY